MERFDKWVLPSGEKHLQEWMQKVNHRENGRLCYQYGKYQEAKKHTKQFRKSIDIGSHVGLWAYHMAHDFKEVQCFEPMQEHIDCWKVNMAGLDNAILNECALGDKNGFVSLECRTKGSSGDTQVSGDGDIPMYILDKFDFTDVDFIKIDCEGFELNVLKGAKDTLLQNKPCIVVEQKGVMSKRYGLEKLGAVAFLIDLGASVKSEISGDYILSW